MELVAAGAGVILRIWLFTMKGLESVPLRWKNWSETEHVEFRAFRHQIVPGHVGSCYILLRLLQTVALTHHCRARVNTAQLGALLRTSTLGFSGHSATIRFFF